MAQTPALHGARDTIWAAYNDLRTAHRSLGLSSGALRSLQAILSFVTYGARLVVHAGNRVLCERAATSERTLRRHIGELVSLGILQRRDSTNGKRFRLGNDGTDLVFGLDVSPLLARAEILAQQARAVRAEEAETRLARQALMLALQHAESVLAPDAEALTEPRRLLRRKVGAEALRAAALDLAELASESGAAPVILTASNSQNDRHIQETEKEESLMSCAPELGQGDDAPQNLRRETEVPEPIAPRPVDQVAPARKQRGASVTKGAPAAPDLLALARACPDATAFCDGPLHSGEDVLRFAWAFGPLIGVPRGLMLEGARSLGPAFAAAAVLRIAQAGARIRSPGAYFRALVTGPKADVFARSLGATAC